MKKRFANKFSLLSINVSNCIGVLMCVCVCIFISVSLAACATGNAIRNATGNETGDETGNETGNTASIETDNTTGNAVNPSTADSSEAEPESSKRIIPTAKPSLNIQLPLPADLTTKDESTASTSPTAKSIEEGSVIEQPMTQVRRITIKDNAFYVEDQPIWINGTNTPWNKWNDFGGGYNDAWWDKHFARLHEEGINAARVWINCNNDQKAVDIDANGFVHGVSEKHWADLDLFFATAARHQIYIMATLISFDHFKDTGSRPAAQSWRNMLASDEAVDSYITYYTLPFVARYGDNPILWSIDLCNEPDWIHENKECGQLPWTDISRFFARNAAAIHENSEILVTVGMSFPKYNVDGANGAGYEGNKVSDAFLQSLYPNENAYLDFWSPHYYDWVGPWYGVPFYVSPYGASPGGWGLDDSKPALIGECLAKGSKGQTQGTQNNTILTDYEQAYLNGWQGVMPWTSNGVDTCGDLDDISPATRHMREQYGERIFPPEG